MAHLRYGIVTWILATGLLATGSLAAQTDSAPGAGPDVPTAEVTRNIAQHLAALVADSISRADSSNVHLEPGAHYVAAEFARLGLRPGLPGESRTDSAWFQRYPTPAQRSLDYDTTAVTLGTFVRKDGVEILDEESHEVRKAVRLPLATAAPLVVGAVREGLNGRYLGPSFVSTRRPKPVVVAGPYTPALALAVAARGKVVFYVPPAGLDPVLEQQIVDTLARASAGVVVLTNEDAERFAMRQRHVARPVPVIDDYMARAIPAPAWAVYVRSDSLGHLFALAGLDLTELRRARTPVVREGLPLSAWFWVSSLPATVARPMSVNVAGVVEGRDSVLKRQYVVISAHVHHDAGVDLVGSDDSSAKQGTSGVRATDASGIAALLAVARAFGEPGARPRRSVLFVVSSGADREFAGAEYVAAKLDEINVRAVANLTLDLIRGRAVDSVVVDGLQEIDFGMSPAWVVAAHPHLRLTTVSRSIMTAPCADHCAFMRRNVPSLYVHDPSAVHGTTSDRPRTNRSTPIDPEYTARVARLAFYLTQAIADAPRSVRWSANAAERLGDPAGD